MLNNTELPIVDEEESSKSIPTKKDAKSVVPKKTLGAKKASSSKMEEVKLP